MVRGKGVGVKWTAGDPRGLSPLFIVHVIYSIHAHARVLNLWVQTKFIFDADVDAHAGGAASSV